MGSEIKIWVRWEEEMVSNDRGRREVHFYVSEDNGRRDLAVVGKEKSARHMVYTIPAKFFHFLIRMSANCSPSAATTAMEFLPSDLKLRSRRQVVDWLSLLVSDSTLHGLSPVLKRSSDDDDASPVSAIPISKILSLEKTICHSEMFSWIGSAWDCRKRRRHYQSFNRNGITVSVHDFVYVLAEDSKRLIAYIEDLFEDVRAKKMVSVRWFHKIDEVSIVLPPNTIDREIFFSLCLQDFSVECIDGLAAVLGFEDFDKFQKETQHFVSSWDPYLCRRVIENDEAKPFDVTQVQGYWSQDLLRSMYPSYLKLRLKIKGQQKFHDRQLDVEGKVNDIKNSSNFCSRNNRLVKQTFSQKQNTMAPGSSIELLSQDSGIRGCWFCCVVLKKHRDKIKVRYCDVQDANGSSNLEEWVYITRIAAPDKLGIRLCKRPLVRPSPVKKDISLCSYEVGNIVDAWWHDGWWEGIVINNDIKGKFHVYFPGEQRASIFCQGDLRPSLDWSENKWNHLKDRPDIASRLLLEQDLEKCSDCITFQKSPFEALTPSYNSPRELQEPTQRKLYSLSPRGVVETLFEKKEYDLLKNCILDGLRWSSSRKRKHRRQLGKQYFSCKRRLAVSSNQLEDNDNLLSNSAFLIPKSMMPVDQENGNRSGDSFFGSQPLTICSKLVMTS